ncbi:MAG: phosphatidate cytidylyltransferase [Sphingopyxis sp.]
MPEPQPKKSDLGVRTASAIVMVAGAGGALWLGGWVWAAFVGAVGLGVLWEWWGLVRRITESWWYRVPFLLAGMPYIGVACWALVSQRNFVGHDGPDPYSVMIWITMVVAVDVGAYFAGRTFGGPKIAPRISPSKTWAGLIGGAIGAGCVVIGLSAFEHFINYDAFVEMGMAEPGQTAWSSFRLCDILGYAAYYGIPVAIIAQTGDFFESWMKRRAEVKDSGTLIPGHGGLFDRVDGLLAVCFVMGVMMWVGS